MLSHPLALLRWTELLKGDAVRTDSPFGILRVFHTSSVTYIITLMGPTVLPQVVGRQLRC